MTKLSEEQSEELEEIANLIELGDGTMMMGTGLYSRIRKLITDRDEARGNKGYIVFNGPFEVYTDLDDAEDRMREVVHENVANQPVVISVALTEENNSLPLGIEMVVESRLAQPGNL